MREREIEGDGHGCHVLRDMSRFRTSAHHLRVETGRWERPLLLWQQRVCDLCDLGAVQDEQHVLLE